MAYGGRISFEGDVAPGEKVLHAAMSLASAHAERMRTMKMDNASRTYDLGDGSYCVVTKLQFREALHIVTAYSPAAAEYVSPLFELELVGTVGIADYVSGVAMSSLLEKVPLAYKDETDIDPSTRLPKEKTDNVDAVHAFTATQRTLQRFSLDVARAKLGVPEASSLAPLRPPTDRQYAQTDFLKPTKFSGRMRRVVQLLLGIGFMRKETAERKWLRAHPTKSGLDPDKQTTYPVEDPPKADKGVVSGFSLPGVLQKKRPSECPKFPVMYDWRFERTHGILKPTEGRAFYVAQVARTGVHIMKLHMDPVSLTKEGRERYLEVLPELGAFFEEFNGFPMPIQFPTNLDIEEAEKAGEVVECLDRAAMQPFYDNFAYSSEHGWCFNDRGDEAHNTAYSYAPEGYQHGHHYSVVFSVTTNPQEYLDSPGSSRFVALARSRKEKWFYVNKARRLSEEQVASLQRTAAGSGGLTAAWEEFKDLTVAPSFVATAKLSLVSKGNLFSRGRLVPPDCSFSGQPQIKFPEPLMGGLLSFEFEPGVKAYSGAVPECDTTMFVMFDKDELKTVKFYSTNRPPVPPEPPPVLEGCDEILGAYSWETGSGTPVIAGNFYATDIDWRTTLYPSVTKERRQVAKAGTYTRAAVTQFFGRCIQVSGFQRIVTKTETEISSGNSLGVSVAMPQNERCGYYMMKTTRAANGVISAKSTEFSSIYGGQTDYYSLYNFVWHWAGAPCGDTMCIAKKGSSEVVETCVEVTPETLDYAVCPAAYYAGTVVSVTGNTGTPPAILGSAQLNGGSGVPPADSSHTDSTVARVEAEVHMVLAGFGATKVRETAAEGADPGGIGGKVDFFSLDISSWWLKASPNCDGNMATLNVSGSCLGAEVVNYEDDIQGDTKSLGGPESMEAHTSATYVGVIET